ncbi:MAG TPA: SpoIIE family protein phosphatase [Ignavibacteriaceae bacterium]|nr:SpoIIE family protein phosphatase [Ignavibacteriaceae bacterium]
MPEKIMVVDDEPDLESLIKQKFRRQIRAGEYDFVFARNGLEALAKLLEHPDISLVLSDINMPEMDGLTLLSKINELKKPTIKTVMVSAYGDMDNIRTAMNRGAFDFLTKPVDFNDMEMTINKTIEQLSILKQALKEHDLLLSIQHDLSVARNIQLAILPKTFPPFPDIKEFEIYASMNAAKEVGGDFYDFFMIDKDRLGFVIGDVSGKGVPAAIFMAVSRTLIRATALKGIGAGECMSYVNNLLCNESVSSMFVTVFYAILNIRTGVVEYSNAGHNPPYLMRTNGEISEIEKTGGIVLGALEDYEFKSNSVKLEPGESIFMFTDGVTEAFNAADDLYSEERLVELLKQLCGKDLKDVVDAVNKDVEFYSTGVPQSDDITILSIKYRNPE